VRQRIALAVVGILIGALAVTGVISLGLERSSIASGAASQLRRQTVALVSSLKSDSTLFRPSDPTAEQQILGVVRRVAGFTSAQVLVIEAQSGRGLRVSPAPAHVSVAQLSLGGLVHGAPSSGTSGDLAYAAAPLFSVAASSGVPATTVVLLLESVISYPADSVVTYILASVIALVVAAIAATVIANRIARRVRAASTTASAIAGGDLDARMPTRRSDYPELAALSTSLNAMGTALARARHQEREFLLSISHDLRTPLTSIRGYAEAIADRVTPDPASAASVVVAESRRLERLIGDLLDLARLEARQFSLHLAQIDAGMVVADAAEALRYQLETAGLSLKVVVPQHELLVSADRDRLAQVVANLVDNASKWSRTTVDVATTRDGDMVGISVLDDGPGIPTEDLPHIFERLFTSRQPAPARSPSKLPEARATGIGLGLTIVAELTRAMNGTVRAESPLGPTGGTRITIELPVSSP